MARRGLDYVFGDVPALAPYREPRSAAEPGAPVTSARAQFSDQAFTSVPCLRCYPQHIGGATNRAARRRARLEEQDAAIEQAQTRARETSVTILHKARALLDDFRRARRRSHPRPRRSPRPRSWQAEARHCSRMPAGQVGSAERQVHDAIAEADAVTRQLRHRAAERRLPTKRTRSTTSPAPPPSSRTRAVALDGERLTLARAEEDLEERTESLARQRQEHEEAEAAAQEAERLQEALEEEFRTLEEALQQDVQQVLERIRQAERELGTRKAGTASTTGAHGASTTTSPPPTATSATSARPSPTRSATCTSRPGSLASSPVRALRPLDRRRRGSAVAGAGRLACQRNGERRPAATLTARQDYVPADPVTAVKHTLPAGVIELIDAFTAATRGGRQVTEGTLKNTQDRMSVALKDFTDALAACEEDYRVDWEPGAVVTVHVIDDEGGKPVSSFARRVDERAKDQGILLEDRERKVLEDGYSPPWRARYIPGSSRHGT